MRLLWVELRDFRNHEHSEITDLPTGLITVVGPNGEGKTNLLEGIDYLFALSSPRSTAGEPLVRRGAGAARARGEVETRAGRGLVEVEIPTKGASRLQVNRSPLRRKRELRRQIRSVFFGPHDLRIVAGEPGARRAFMDEALGVLNPVKESLVAAYDKSLRQRNRLLKEHEGAGAPPAIEVWDEELVTAGTALMRARAEAIAKLAPTADEEYRWLAGYGLRITYLPNVAGDPSAKVDEASLTEAFRARIAERRADELIRRTTLVGPHRDELDLEVRDLTVRGFASHGESWAAALCLRLGLAKAVEAEIGEPPVLLVDDPFSALDPARQRRVAEHLERRGQVLISVFDDALIPKNTIAVWDVSSGRVAVRDAAA
ncbi:MAG: DNA replication and repair protein RecF [Actinomycetota bacterium]